MRTNFVCSKCKESLPVEAFYRKEDSPRGYRYECRRCTAATQAAHRARRKTAVGPQPRGPKPMIVYRDDGRIYKNAREAAFLTPGLTERTLYEAIRHGRVSHGHRWSRKPFKED